MTKLPKGWEWTVFSDIATVASNLVNPANYGSMPHIAPNHIESNTGKLLPFTTVSQDGVTSPKHLFCPGQILYSKIRPYLNKVANVEFSGLCSADMYPIETAIDTRFLRWWMLTRQFSEAAARHQGRSLLPKINSKALAQLPAPVPPLAEQHRIVAALEDHLSHLDAGQSYVRQITYQAAKFSSSYLSSLLQGAGRCAWPKLGDLAHDSRYGTSEKCSYDGNGIPVVRIPNVQSGQIELSDLKYTLQTNLKLDDLMIRRGDVLFIRTNGSRNLIGRAAVAKTDLDAAFASYLIRFRLNRKLVNPQWVNTVVQSPALRAEIESLAASSAGQYNLNISKLASLKIPVPPLQMQEDLLSQFEEASDSASRLNRSTLQLDSRAAQLRRSLLSEAFAGRLVPQNPDDEPASVLLERIRAERAAQPKPKRTRRATPPVQETLL